MHLPAFAVQFIPGPCILCIDFARLARTTEPSTYACRHSVSGYEKASTAMRRLVPRGHRCGTTRSVRTAAPLLSAGRICRTWYHHPLDYYRRLCSSLHYVSTGHRIR
eukprot:2450620-Rhodomonas_salina.1